MEVSYFKSSLDSHLLDLLWNKYWVNTLSSCSLLTVSVLLTSPSPFVTSSLLPSLNRMLTTQHSECQIYHRN